MRQCQCPPVKPVSCGARHCTAAAKLRVQAEEVSSSTHHRRPASRGNSCALPRFRSLARDDHFHRWPRHSHRHRRKNRSATSTAQRQRAPGEIRIAALCKAPHDPSAIGPRYDAVYILTDGSCAAPADYHRHRISSTASRRWRIPHDTLLLAGRRHSIRQPYDFAGMTQVCLRCRQMLRARSPCVDRMRALGADALKSQAIAIRLL